FAAACCRRAWAALPDHRLRNAVEILERFADVPGGKADQAELKVAFTAAQQVVAETVSGTAAFYAARAVGAAVEPTLGWWTARWSADLWLAAVGKGAPNVWGVAPRTARRKEAGALAALLRCVIGSPSRPAPDVSPAVLAWNDGAVVKMAKVIYDERRWEELPLLADGLEEAGADDAGGLLGHLQGPGPHAVGCFGLDAVLGRF